MISADSLLIGSNQGDKMFKSARKTKLWLLTILFFITGLPAIFAGLPVNINSTITAPTPIGIGSVLSVSSEFESDEANTAATVSMPGVTNPTINVLTVTSLGGKNYLATGQFTVVAGTINSSVACQIIVSNASGTEMFPVTLTLDNKAPQRNGVMTATVNGMPYTGDTLKAGDAVILSQAIMDTDISTVLVNLSAVRMGSVNMTFNGTSYIASFTVPAGIDTPMACDVTITDTAGNVTSYVGNNTLNLFIDSTNPTFVPSVTNNAGNVVAVPGNQLVFTAQVDNYDNDSISVTCTELITNHPTFVGYFPIQLLVQGNPTVGQPATFRGSLTLPPDETVYYDSNLAFQFTCRDNAGNVTKIEATFNNILDLGGFVHKSSKVDVYSAENVRTYVATAASQLYFYSNITTTMPDLTTVVVNLAPIGGSTLNLQYDDTLGLYVATYSSGITGVSLDGEYVTFEVTATNQYDSSITKTTTPPILIDNVGPQIMSFTINGATGRDGSIINKDKITFNATVSGANAPSNPVRLDLTNLDGSGDHSFVKSTSNQWYYRHTVGKGDVDDLFDFVLRAEDNHGNTAETVISHLVDNQPPVYVSQDYSADIQQNPPYMIIGDRITTTVTLESADDGNSVVIDLTKLGNLGKESFTSMGNEYSYTFDIATGPINNGAIFPLLITDNAGNQAVDQATGDTFNASFTFKLLDQNPPDPLTPVITLTNHTDTVDKYPNSINTKKTIIFSLPYQREASNDDHATATVDVTYLCKLTDGSMVYVDESLNETTLPTTTNLAKLIDSSSHYRMTVVATDTIGLESKINYQFTFTMYDKSGNKSVVNSQAFQKIDLDPPQITSIEVGTSGKNPLTIGDVISIKVFVANNDGQAPTIDLRSLDPELGSAMMSFENLGVYYYNVTIATGSLDNVVASWCVTVYDGCDNTAASFTREVNIDNKPPQITSFLVTADSITNFSRINYTDNHVNPVEFKITASEPLSVTIDLTAIGGSPLQTMTETVSGSDYIYTYTTTTEQYSEEFSNYVFEAVVRDTNGNRIKVYSQSINTVDCLVPSLNELLCGVEISARNEQLPAPSKSDIVRIGDTVTFFASMTAGLDAVASVTMCVDPGVASVSKTMTLNTEKNRLEASIVIKAAGVVEQSSIWGNLELNKLNYVITAADDAANIASPSVSGITEFKVKNTYPTIEAFSLEIIPDYDTVGVLNIASNSVREWLVASATLANGDKPATATLDLTNILPSLGHIPLASITESVVNNTGKGIDVASYAVVDYLDIPVSITISDEAGYSCGTYTSLVLDTKAPEITEVTFDGAKIIVAFSETIYDIDKTKWKLVGSATVPIGTTAKLDLSDTNLVDSWDEMFETVEINLSKEGRRIVTNWASTSLYLEAARDNTNAAANDAYKNWLPKYEFFPVTITDITWREDPSINNFTMTHQWPDTIYFDLSFTHDMATDTLIASDGVIFVDPPSTAEFADVSYDSWYVFQKDDVASWTDSKTLRITLCDSGRDWIAVKLGNNLGRKLKFAQKSRANVMLLSEFNKKLKIYTVAEPYPITDNRDATPLQALNVLSDPQPVINLGSATITLTFNDRAVLFIDNFGTENEYDPLIKLPYPTDNKGITTHQNHIYLFNVQNDQSIKLNCKGITAADNEFASTTVTIKLTNEDIENILDFYNQYDILTWGLQVDADCFTNLWGMGNTKYKPTTPGQVTMIEATVTEDAYLLACSVSDMPPTKDNGTEFVYDFELQKPKAGEIELPFLMTASPTAGIFETSTGNVIASGTITGWSSRTVRSSERAILTFNSNETFLKDVNGVEAELRLYGLKDIFGNEVPVQIASYVYDRNKRDGSAVTGFSTASEPFTIDNIAPVATITPTLIGITAPSKDIFCVDYSEEMSSSSIPSLSLATDGAVISFSFDRWEASGTRAVFTNNQGITPSTMNGIWIYNLSGGEDLASNAFVTMETEAKIKSEIPRVKDGSMNIYTKRNNIDANKIVVNKPFNLDASPDYIEIGFEYTTANTENLPHYLSFYDSSDNMIGSATVVQNGTLATATISAASFNTVPTTNCKLTVRIVDSATNKSDPVRDFDYYANGPVASDLKLTGVASYTGGVYYYTTALDDMKFTGTTTSYYTELNILVASYSVPMSPIATMTVYSEISGYDVTGTFGKTLGENIYFVTFADEAGNLMTGKAPLVLMVDDTPPTLASIIPGPTDMVANTPAGMATFTVVFNEIMDTTATFSLELATTTMNTSITMNFVGWGDDMMTASFTNAVAITSTMPVGLYNYYVAYAKDISGNVFGTTPTTFVTDVQPKGPGANLTVLSLQPDILDGVLENRAFNPDRYTTGDAASVSFRLDYISGPFNTPHQLLVYDKNDKNIATLTPSVANPGLAVSTDDPNFPTDEGTYSFNMIDNLGNYGPDTGYMTQTFTIDKTAPTVSKIDFDDSNIGQTIGGIKYYSPSNGVATITLTTTDTDNLWLIVASDTATSTYEVFASESYKLSFGSDLVGKDGDVTISVVDAAGNPSAATMQLRIDSIPPQVMLATAVDETDTPITLIGKEATVLVMFDSDMNQNIPPVVTIATDTTLGTTEVATLTFSSWVDSTTCKFTTNGVFDTIDYPVGTSTIRVADARDLAGNLVASAPYGEVEVISSSPKYYATLYSKQSIISENELTNVPFSPNVAPGVATLTINYNKGPYALDHELLVFDGTGTQVATHTLTDGATDYAVDNSFFYMPDGTAIDASNYNGSFTIKLKDALGNLSDVGSSSETIPFVINYDGISPQITGISVEGVSSASVLLTNYYNPEVTGSVTIKIDLNNSEPVKLLVYGIGTSAGIATRTYEMVWDHVATYTYQGDLTYLSEKLPEGTYKISAVDMAGNQIVYNFAPTVKAEATFVVDTAAPVVLNATMTASTYISSGDAGMATFTVQFNETMFGAGYQYLEIATNSYKIPCRFVRLETTTVTNDTAVFETAIAVPSTILQGSYVYRITGTDLAGNVVNTDFGEIFVKSEGPIVTSITAMSYQATTASDTLDSGNEMLFDQPFSFNVEPKAATLSIELSEAPDGDASMVYVNFSKKITRNNTQVEIIVASHAVALDANLVATFTWDASTEPLVATSATYIIRIADANKDISYYSYEWNVDCESPLYTGISITGGVDVPASGVVYLNPYRHTDFEINFKNVTESSSPRLRITNGVSTDTYALTPLSNNAWKVGFRGKHSRPTNNPDALMPDGIYDIGLADVAGNMASSGTECLYQMVIDTKSPEIGTFTLSIGGVEVTETCSPTALKPLTITLGTSETLTATGVAYIDVYNTGNVRINRLQLKEDSGKLVATWDGKNAEGNTVSDGNYTFKASDYCGNSSEKSATINAITAEFMAMPPAVQTGSQTVKVWFNQPIASSTIGASSITMTPALTISNIKVVDERAIEFDTGKMTHGASYTVTITGISNIYGSTISDSTNKVEFIADTKGPSIVATSYDGANTQGEILIIFDQELDRVSGESLDSYEITDSTGVIMPLSKAIMQSDNMSVMLYASGTFLENANYKVKAPGVKDEFGNNACESSLNGFSFKGRDITPPTFTISAFSNAANENDIIVLVVSSEELKAVPTLTIKHGSASPITMAMQKNSGNKLVFMSTASLKASNGGSGNLTVNGEDLNGNKGTGNGTFVLAAVKANTNARLSTKDGQFTITVEKTSLKEDATIKILQRSLIKDETASGTIQTKLQSEYNTSFRGVRASVTTANDEATNNELTPLTDAYEATVAASKVDTGVVAALKVPEASSTQGIGLFYQKNGSWKFASANITDETREIKARLASTQVFAIMRDSVEPTIKLDDSINLSEAFETSRPQFKGKITDFGSGIDANTVQIKIDGVAETIKLEDDGSFDYKPLRELTNGNHDLIISASDHTGNPASTGSMRFSLVLPFEFKQIIQYPNPARSHTTIRIRTNSTGVNCNIRVKIYDVAGHKVADFDESDVMDRHDGNYEVRWDLTNLRGKKVANGTYLARIEAINPETGKKVKKTLKLAVLK